MRGRSWSIWRAAGILLNRIRVEPGHPEPPSDRDMIVIGPWTLLVRLVGGGQTEPSLESTERMEQPDDAAREDALYATRDSIFLRLRADGTIDRELGWNEFAEKYSRVIAGFARNAGLRAQEIDDVLQDVLMGFFRVSADFNYDPTKGRFRGYLKRVTLNAIRSRFRRRRPDVNVDPEWELPAHDEASDAAWDRQWTEQLFFRAMDRVRDRVEERTWKSFELYGLRGTAIDAVAEETGMTPEAIRHAKMRITRQIRASWTNCGPTKADHRFGAGRPSAVRVPSSGRRISRERMRSSASSSPCSRSPKRPVGGRDSSVASIVLLPSTCTTMREPAAVMVMVCQSSGP